jgi:hypothetical protein
MAAEALEAVIQHGAAGERLVLLGSRGIAEAQSAARGDDQGDAMGQACSFAMRLPSAGLS